MELTRSLVLIWLLVLAVASTRLVELRLSRRRQEALRDRGVGRVAEPAFPAMVVLHAGILLGAALEPALTGRPPVPLVSLVALLVLAGATALRLWVIATLGPHWNVQVMNSVSLGVVTTGPFRFIRHPNYVAVFLELGALPLVHSAWWTATLGAAVHLWVLAQRIRTEEAALFAHPEYRRRMGAKPRFLPRLGGGRAGLPWGSLR